MSSSSMKARRKQLRRLALFGCAAAVAERGRAADECSCLDASDMKLSDGDLVDSLLPLLVDAGGVFTYAPDDGSGGDEPALPAAVAAAVDRQLEKLRRRRAARGVGAVLMPRVVALNVSGNERLRDSGVVSLAQMLRGNTTLRSVDMRRVGVSNAGLAAFADILCGNTTLCRLQTGEPPPPAIGPGMAFAPVGDDDGDGTLMPVGDAKTRALLRHITAENARLAPLSMTTANDVVGNARAAAEATSFVLTGRWPAEPYSVDARRVPCGVQRIDLSNNGLAALPAALFARVSDGLIELVVAGNRLTALPVELLVCCRRLMLVDLSHNRLTALPDEFAALEGRLLSLNVAGNRLTALPPSLVNLMSLRELRVAGNPLRGVPPALVAAGSAAELLNYMRMMRAGTPSGGARRRGKLLLVGGAGAGKSTLLAALAGVPSGGSKSAGAGTPSPTPPLVRITSFVSHGSGSGGSAGASKGGGGREPVKFVAWDYGSGGAAQRCARHMFVAASRGRDAVFLLAVRCRRLIGRRADDVLAELSAELRALCGYDNSEPGADNPIVLVFTAADELSTAPQGVAPTERASPTGAPSGSGDESATVVQQTLPTVLDGLSSTFPNVVGAVMVSAAGPAGAPLGRGAVRGPAPASTHGVDELRQLLVDMALAQDTNRFAGVPAWYADFAEYLPQFLRSGALRPVMTHDEVYDALRRPGQWPRSVPPRVERADVHALLRYANDVGVVLDCPALDAQPVVLDPEWLGAVLARVYADDGDVARCNGVHAAARIDAAIARCVGGDARLSAHVGALMRSMSMLVPLSAASSARVLRGAPQPAYLLPELLSHNERRAAFYEAALFSQSPPQRRRSVHRVFVFREPPLGLIEHVMARMVASAGANDDGSRDQYVLVEAWSTGLLVYWRDDASGRASGGGGGGPGGSIMVFMTDARRLAVRVAANRENGHLAPAMRLFRALTVMFREWMQVEYTPLAACAHSDRLYLDALQRADDAALRRSPLHFVDVGALRDRRPSGDGSSGGDSLLCAHCGERSPVSFVAPDMCIENVRHFIDDRPGDAQRLLVLADMSGVVLQRQLGAGAFGVVHRAVVGGEIVAIKMLQQQPTPEDAGISTGGGADLKAGDAVDEVFAEVAAMLQMPPHPNLMALRGVVRQPLGVIVEFANMGSLYEYIHERPQRRDDDDDVAVSASERGHCGNATAVAAIDDTVERLGIALGVARGVHAMHANRVLHRDLKSPNVLLHRTDDGAVVAKVADFGLAADMHMTDRLSAVRVENPMWLAPELLALRAGGQRRQQQQQQQRAAYTEKSDVYALGIVLYELFYERMPYESRFDAEIERMITQGVVPPLGGDNVPPPVDTLIAACLSRHQTERPTAARCCAALSSALAHYTRATVALRRSFEPAADDNDKLPLPLTVSSTLFGGHRVRRQ